MLRFQLVPPGRLELPRPCGHWILSPTRLPVPPQRPVEGRCFFKPRNRRTQEVFSILSRAWALSGSKSHQEVFIWGQKLNQSKVLGKPRNINKVAYWLLESGSDQKVFL